MSASPTTAAPQQLPQEGPSIRIGSGTRVRVSLENGDTPDGDVLAVTRFGVFVDTGDHHGVVGITWPYVSIVGDALPADDAGQADEPADMSEAIASINAAAFRDQLRDVAERLDAAVILCDRVEPNEGSMPGDEVAALRVVINAAVAKVRASVDELVERDRAQFTPAAS